MLGKVGNGLSRSIWLSGAVLLVLSTATVVSAFTLLTKERRSITAAAAAVKELPPLSLPEDVVKYSQVPKHGKPFTAITIPKRLLKDHSTKAGTWGRICVSRGSLAYIIQYQPSPLRLELLAPATAVIEPQQLHHVQALTEDVEFVVEFYRKPGTGPVDEKRE
jgi:tellurite resistance-related uncharacterized protein